MQIPTLPSVRLAGLLPLLPLLSLLLGGALVACGGSVDAAELTERGLRELNTGDAGAAANHLDRALETLSPDDPDHVRAQAGLALALASIDPEEGHRRFLAFAAAHPDRVDPELYRTVGEGMFRAGARPEGVDVVGQGVARHPEDTALAQIFEQLKQRASKEATPDELAHLRSLGYVGAD